MRWADRRSGTFGVVALCAAALLATAGCGTDYAALGGGGTNSYVFTENFQFDQGTFNNTNDTTVPGTVRLNFASDVVVPEVVFGGFVPNGTWTVVVDSGTTDAQWDTIFWNTEPEASQPPGTQINVAVRAANNSGDLTSIPFTPVGNGSSLAGFSGRFLEVQATLIGNFKSKPADGSTFGISGQTPVLSDLTVTQTLPGNNLIEQLPFGYFFGAPTPNPE